MKTKRIKGSALIVTLMVAVILLMFLESCNNFLAQDKTSVSVELPANLFEILSSKATTNRKVSDSDAFILTATMSGSVTQSQIKEITKVSEPLSIVFSDVPFNSVITVEIAISRDDMVLYSGKSQPTTITNVDTSIEVTLSVKTYPVGTDLPNIKIGVKTYDKTSEIVVIEKGTTANVHKKDDSSWSSYYNKNDNNYKGVFIKDRNVTLSPFIMGKYEVTQELYTAVMGENPSSFKGEDNPPAKDEIQKLRPVEQVTWYKAVEFCNKLTEQTMGKDNCVYYTEEDFKNVYETGTDVYMNPDKKGYRLPTEAEWEFAARGGDPIAKAWGYSYAGVHTQISLDSFITSETDIALNGYGWYNGNAGEKTHEVGKLTPNTLGLFDMSGNVYEWCYDRYNNDVTSDDEVYTKNGTVTNPLGATSGENRISHGNGWTSLAYGCAISHRDNGDPSATPGNNIGFRVCRYQ